MHAGSGIRGLVQLMGLERQFVFAVRFEPLAPEAPALRVGIDDFGDSREALQSLRQPVAQIDQQIGCSDASRAAVKCTGVSAAMEFAIFAILMRYEGSVVECPQQLIDRLGIRGISLKMTTRKSRRYAFSVSRQATVQRCFAAALFKT